MRFINSETRGRSPSGEDLEVIVINQNWGLYVIVINQNWGLYAIYKLGDTRAQPDSRGFINRIQT